MMKFKLIIDPLREEEVIVYVRQRSALVDKIEQLIREEGEELFGFRDGNAVKLDAASVLAFTVEDGRVIAVTENANFAVRERLYQLEERFGHGFVKINQSCLVRVSKIERFDTSIGGSLMVTLKGGYRDYVSRRQLKTVKERMKI